MDRTRFDELESYLQKEVLPATSDLEKLADRNRKHVQKLVFTNLVDRFDSTVDGTLLANCRSDLLLEEATKGMSQAITEADLVKLLMQSADLQSALDVKVKASLRNSILRQRHSTKLAWLFKACSAAELANNDPRVNISTGTILDHIKPQQGKIPYSICGYADWLYSKRNAIVHGSGINKFLENDVAQMKKHFKCTPAATFRIKLNSISIAATFYKQVADKLRESAEA